MAALLNMSKKPVLLLLLMTELVELGPVLVLLRSAPPKSCARVASMASLPLLPAPRPVPAVAAAGATAVATVTG